jgi:putative modified peptide
MTDAILTRDFSETAESGTSENFSTAKAGTLSKVQGMALLSRLVNDEQFRARFEQAPAAAFAEIGIPAEQISTLKDICLAPRSLASRQVLEASRQRLAAEVDTSVLALMIPTLKI